MLGNIRATACNMPHISTYQQGVFIIRTAPQRLRLVISIARTPVENRFAGENYCQDRKKRLSRIDEGWIMVVVL
jgi:hypothetical protein